MSRVFIIDDDGTEVSTDEPVVVKRDDIVVNRYAVAGQGERTAVTRQQHLGRVCNEITVDMGITSRAGYFHIADCISFKPDVVAGNEGVSPNKRESVETGCHVERSACRGIVEGALQDDFFSNPSRYKDFLLPEAWNIIKINNGK